MILDRLEQIQRYVPLHPLFLKAVEFIRRSKLQDLPLGRHEIDGKRLYAIVGRDKARTRDQAKLEAHRKYIDIQIVLSGTDEMGWKSTPTCKKSEGPYDSEKDFENFLDAPDAWVAVGPGAFVIFFPEDAHAPLVGVGELHKVVIKVAVG
jgi:YhcH/YjgK/YiaL family protein